MTTTPACRQPAGLRPERPKPALTAVVLTANEPTIGYHTTDGTAPTSASPSGPSPVVINGLDVAEGDVTVTFCAIDLNSAEAGDSAAKAAAAKNTATKPTATKGELREVSVIDVYHRGDGARPPPPTAPSSRDGDDARRDEHARGSGEGAGSGPEAEDTPAGPE